MPARPAVPPAACPRPPLRGAGPVSVPYVDGYWRERRFPDHALHGLRRAPDLVWDPSATDLPAHLDRETPDYPQ